MFKVLEIRNPNQLNLRIEKNSNKNKLGYWVKMPEK